jgi:hypothetical protein
MIPDFANNIEENASTLLNDTEDSTQHWNDPKSDDFHGYMSNVEYRYTIFTFTDEMKVTFGVLDRAEEQMKRLESDCTGSGGFFGTFHNAVPYNFSDKFHKEQKNIPVYSPEQLDEIKNKYVNPTYEAMKREQMLKPQPDISKYHGAGGEQPPKINVPELPDDDIIRVAYNDGDYDYIFKGKIFLGKKPNRQHYREY